MDLHVLGWNHFFERYWNANARGGVMPGRVVEEQKEAYRVVGKSGEFAAEVTGRLRHEASGRADFPAVGDWVVMDTIPSEEKALIHEVLPRRTKLSRKVAGDRSSEQILVTNVDVAFVVMSLNADFNPRRLERYLGAIWESGAQPVVRLQQGIDLPVVRPVRLQLPRTHRDFGHLPVRALCPGLSRTRPGAERIRRPDAERHVLRRLRRLPADLLAGDRHRRQIEGCAPSAGVRDRRRDVTGPDSLPE